MHNFSWSTCECPIVWPAVFMSPQKVHLHSPWQRISKFVARDLGLQRLHCHSKNICIEITAESGAWALKPPRPPSKHQRPSPSLSHTIYTAIFSMVVRAPWAWVCQPRLRGLLLRASTHCIDVHRKSPVLLTLPVVTAWCKFLLLFCALAVQLQSPAYGLILNLTPIKGQPFCWATSMPIYSSLSTSCEDAKVCWRRGLLPSSLAGSLATKCAFILELHWIDIIWPKPLPDLLQTPLVQCTRMTHLLLPTFLVV